MSSPELPSDEAAADVDHTESKLSGTLVAVLLMAAFFVATWVGMFLLLVSRR